MGSVLITGATGYIGHRLAKRLLDMGLSVHALARRDSTLSRLQSLGGKLEVHVIDGESSGLSPGLSPGLSQCLKRAEAETVFHLAGDSSGGDFQKTLEANFLFGARLLEAMNDAGTRRMVNTGSFWQFDEEGKAAPNSLYAAAKQAFQDILGYYAAHRDMGCVTLMLFDVYGPGDWRNKLMHVLLEASQGSQLDMTGGKQLLDSVHVDDVVEAYVTAYERLQSDEHGVHQTFFVGSGERVTLKDLVREFENACAKPLAVNWGAKPYPPHQIFRPCPAEPRLPGWSARISLPDGLRQVVEFDQR